MLDGMTNIKASEVLKELKVYIEDLPHYSPDEVAEGIEMAIKLLEQQPITWIVGKDNCQVAVRNMPIDKMQKICAIIGEEESQLCEDAISRTEAIENFASWYGYDYDNQGYYRLLKQMSSVAPSYNSIKTELKPCGDCVSREEVLNLFRPSEELQDSTLSKHWFDFVSKYINKLPSVQLQKKKGKWIVTEDDLDGVNFPSFSCECSECGADFSWKTDFCPHCGADMNGGEEV